MRRASAVLTVFVTTAVLLTTAAAALPPPSPGTQGQRVINDPVGDVKHPRGDLRRVRFAYVDRAVEVTFRTVGRVRNTTLRANLIPDHRRDGGVFFLNTDLDRRVRPVGLSYARRLNGPGRDFACQGTQTRIRDPHTLWIRVPVRCLAAREPLDRRVWVGAWSYAGYEQDFAPGNRHGTTGYRALVRRRS